MSLYSYNSGAWRLGHSFDAWDASAGVWRDVREIWGFASGFWRLIYRRAFLDLANTGATVVEGDPFPSYLVDVSVGGTAAGTVSCVIRVNGADAGGGFIGVPGAQQYSVPGTAGPDTIDVRIFTARGRLLETAVVF